MFTSDELVKFATRYSNGYDLLINRKYVAWLRINHPADYARLIKNNDTVHNK